MLVYVPIPISCCTRSLAPLVYTYANLALDHVAPASTRRSMDVCMLLANSFHADHRTAHGHCCSAHPLVIELSVALTASCPPVPSKSHVGRLGAPQHGGFYSCHNEKTKRMRMMNLGLKTDGKKHVLPIPPAWTEVALRACQVAVEMDPSIPIPRPDICVVNHYTAASRLGWHQADLSSRRDSGLPVISFSLGQPATFQYRISWKKSAQVKSVRLESGDALIFGGRSRGIIHGVPRIDTAVDPPPAVIVPPAATRSSAAEGAEGRGAGPCVVPGGGRFNLNFREL
ncbi:unnamed protein product [Ectocarpus sp. 12 AP-2014]